MQEQDTINILVSQLLSKDDELLRIRKDNERLREEQREGNRQILEKLDKALDELKSMRRDNKNLAGQLSKALEGKAQAEKKSELLSSALEELKNLRAAELFEIEKQKRQLYGRKSEKSSSLRKVSEKDLKSEKDDFDGSNPPEVSCEDLSTPATPKMSNSESSSSACPVSQPQSSDYSKRSTRVNNVVMHYCDESGIPSDARKIDVRHWILYKLDWSVTKHVFELLRLIDKEGAISNYYKADEAHDTLHPFENVLPGYHVDIDMIAQILVDKYQYSMSLERVVDRFKDVDADFSSSTVLSWVHRHIRELDKLDAPLRSVLLTEGSFLFCDETTGQVKVFNKSTGKFEYRKKYIWGIKNPALKVAYYLYDQGSRSMTVAEKFFRNFFGSITTDGYNVYKLFDRHRKGITRYGCMAHVRRKFVDALNTDHRSVEIIRLISELYWIETDCRIHLLSEEERVFERRQRSLPLLSQLWQFLKPIFDETEGFAANLFIKAVRYAVNEWEAICRYVNNGQAEIDNNTAGRMMKPVCLGRKNYLFCGSEQAAKNTSLIYSIIESCKMNGLRPVKYIADVLRKLVSGETDYMALLPMNIAK